MRKPYFILLFTFFLGIGVALLTTGHAFAQESPIHASDKSELNDIEENVFKDRTYQSLQSIFDSVMKKDGQETTLNEMFRRFSVIIFALAMAWSGYIIVLGSVNSAKDGEVFGRGWSTFFGPARFIFGLGGMVPVFSGFPALAGAVLYCAKWGVIAANYIWMGGVVAITDNMIPISAPQQSSNVQFIQQMFNMQLCKNTINEFVKSQYSARNMFAEKGAVTIPENELVQFSVATPTSLAFSYNPANGPATSVDKLIGENCGSIVMDLNSNLKTADRNSKDLGIENRLIWDEVGMVHFVQVQKLMEIADEITLKIARYAVEQKTMNFYGEDALDQSWKETGVLTWLSEAVDVFDEAYSDASPKIAIARQGALAKANVTPSDIIRLFNAADAYDQEVINHIDVFQTIDGQVNSGGNALREMFKKEAINSGWSSAGRYWLTISRINGRTMNMATFRPSYEVVDLASLYDEAQTSMERPLRNAFYMAEQFWRFKYTGGNVETNEYYDLAREYSGEAVDPKYMSRGILKWIAKFNAGGGGGGQYEAIEDDEYAQGFMANGETDPISRMTDFGHVIMGSVETMLGVSAAASLAEGFYSNFTPTGKITKVAKKLVIGGSKGFDWLSAGLGLLFMVGVYFAFVLPFMIWVHYLLAVVGWIILVMEAVLAAPLFALIHMNFKGEEFIDHRMIPGWMILLSIAVKPGLIVISFFMSMAAFSIISRLISADFLPWMLGVIGDNVVGLPTIIIMVCLIGVSYVMLSRLSFRVMTSIPDNIVSKWIGGPSTAMLEEQDAAATTTALTGASVFAPMDSMASRKSDTTGENISGPASLGRALGGRRQTTASEGKKEGKPQENKASGGNSMGVSPKA